MKLRNTAAIAALAFAGAIGPASAGTEGEEDTLVINRINATDFEVIEQQDMSPRAFWCGAATFIERRQGQPNTTPIYLKRERGASVTAPGRKGVVFSTDGAGLPQPGTLVSVSVRQPGQMLKSYQARGFCRDAFTRATK